MGSTRRYKGAGLPAYPSGAKLAGRWERAEARGMFPHPVRRSASRSAAHLSGKSNSVDHFRFGAIDVYTLPTEFTTSFVLSISTTLLDDTITIARHFGINIDYLTMSHVYYIMIRHKCQHPAGSLDPLTALSLSSVSGNPSFLHWLALAPLPLGYCNSNCPSDTTCALRILIHTILMTLGLPKHVKNWQGVA